MWKLIRNPILNRSVLSDMIIVNYLFLATECTAAAEQCSMTCKTTCRRFHHQYGLLRTDSVYMFGRVHIACASDGPTWRP